MSKQILVTVDDGEDPQWVADHILALRGVSDAVVVPSHSPRIVSHDQRDGPFPQR